MHEKGIPKSFWITKMSNGTDAVATNKVEFLGLEVGGGTSMQNLTVKKESILTGRNEIRVIKNGSIILEGGTLLSQQWIDIKSGGTLQGFGNIQAALYSRGTLCLSTKSPLVVSKKAVLAGTLIISNPDKPSSKNITLLKAKSIEGRFENAEVIVAGETFKILYSPNSVSLEAVN